MKVSRPASAQGSAAPAAARGVGPGFRIDVGGEAAAARPAPGAAAAIGVGGVDTLLALQGAVDPAQARALALRKGRRLVDALDRLRLALLEETVTAGHLARLRTAAAGERAASDDPELDDTLRWAEVRAAVEMAKLERAFGQG
jgi:hypothetical protein